MTQATKTTAFSVVGLLTSVAIVAVIGWLITATARVADAAVSLERQQSDIRERVRANETNIEFLQRNFDRWTTETGRQIDDIHRYIRGRSND